MTDKHIPKSAMTPTPEKSKTSAEVSGASVEKTAPKRSGALYGFVTFVVITGTALVVWQGDHYERIKAQLPDLPEISIPAISATTASNPAVSAPAASSEELSRFRIVKQELGELRTSHEALARNFLNLQKEFEEYKTSIKASPAPTIAAETPEPASEPVAAPVVEAPSIPAPAVEEIAALNARIDALQKQMESQSGLSQTRLRLLETIEALQGKLNNGLPYKEELKTLKSIVGADSVPRASVFILQQNAENGVPSLGDLTLAFSDIARQAVPASLAANKDADFGDKIRASFGNLINIRKIDVEVEDTSDEADIARAEAELRAGNVEMALTHLSQLTDTSKAAFSGWIIKANAFLDTRSALGTVREIWLPTTINPSKPAAE